MTNKLVLEIYTDYVCPRCYLCTGRIEKIIQNYSITTQVIHFPLHPDTPEEGMTLEAIFFGSSYDFKTAEIHLAKHMDKEGLPYNRPEFTYNSRLAQELAAWAVDAHEEHRIHGALFRAYFVDRMNIAKIDNLIRIADSINLPEREAGTVLEKRSYQSKVDEDWKRSRNKGITGVPAFAMSDSCVVGAQPYEILEKMVSYYKIEPRTSNVTK